MTPTDEMRDMLAAAWLAGDAGASIEWAIPFIRDFKDAIHCGDCTKVAHTCNRCVVDSAFEAIKPLLEAARPSLPDDVQLRDALKDVTVHLIAANSLLRKLHDDLAPSKKHALFEAKIGDYDASAERGRAIFKGTGV